MLCSSAAPSDAPGPTHRQPQYIGQNTKLQVGSGAPWDPVQSNQLSSSDPPMAAQCLHGRDSPSDTASRGWCPLGVPVPLPGIATRSRSLPLYTVPLHTPAQWAALFQLPRYNPGPTRLLPPCHATQLVGARPWKALGGASWYTGRRLVHMQHTHVSATASCCSCPPPQQGSRHGTRQALASPAPLRLLWLWPPPLSLPSGPPALLARPDHLLPSLT